MPAEVVVRVQKPVADRRQTRATERIPFDAVTAGLPAGKFLLLNTALPARYAQAAMDRKVYTLNAKDISVSHGIAKPEDPFPLINSAMAGAFFKLFEYITGRTVPDELTRRIFEGALPVKTDENFLAFSDAKRLVQPLAASETPGEYPSEVQPLRGVHQAMSKKRHFF
ncbi:MAG: hypothetical protein UX72_C0012G0002 [Parcubacteria group bacterium GW2011_GWA2_47_10]|nr:MAG: hypothetical protein UX72_C0012G0002 [Parcubacteria group bacterium GW2011_GWA2_47_10]